MLQEHFNFSSSFKQRKVGTLKQLNKKKPTKLHLKNKTDQHVNKYIKFGFHCKYKEFWENTIFFTDQQIYNVVN